jgi:hypothetical protein
VLPKNNQLLTGKLRRGQLYALYVAVHQAVNIIQEKIEEKFYITMFCEIRVHFRKVGFTRYHSAEHMDEHLIEPHGFISGENMNTWLNIMPYVAA